VVVVEMEEVEMEEVEMEENDDLLQLTSTVSSDNQHKSSPAISSPSACGIWWRKACSPKKKIEGSRRHEYRPTQKCQDLLGVLVAFSEWGEQWLPDPDGPLVEIHHADSGHPVGMRPLLLDECREVSPGEVELVQLRENND